MPQQLMQQFQKTSARESMNVPLLKGALDGAKRAALDVFTNADRERFGGNIPATRTLESRGIPSGALGKHPEIPAGVAETIPEGKFLHTPDGSFKKINGALVPVDESGKVVK